MPLFVRSKRHKAMILYNNSNCYYCYDLVIMDVAAPAPGIYAAPLLLHPSSRKGMRPVKSRSRDDENVLVCPAVLIEMTEP